MANDGGQLYVSLITDLLSSASTSLPSTTPSHISYQLASASTTSLGQLVSTLASSPSLWLGRALYSPDLCARDIPFERAKDVYLAVCRGVLGRVDQVRQEYGEGWRARRQLSLALEAVWQGIEVANEEEGQRLNPTVGLIITSGVLAALQEVRARRDVIYVGGRNLLPSAEDRCLLAWVDVLEELKKSEYGQGRVGGWESEWHREHEGGRLSTQGDTRLVPCWLAAEVLPAVAIKKLRNVPADPLLDLLTTGIAAAFDDGHMVDHLDDDLTSATADPGPSLAASTSPYQWLDPSPSRDRLKRLAALPLSPQLGRLAKTHGRVIESVSTVEDLSSVGHQLRRLESMSSQLHRAWSKTRWSSADSATVADPAWDALKGFLYTATVVYASVATLLTEGATALPAKGVLEIAGSGLRTFGWLAFVVARFGTDGTDMYKQGWWGLIDAIKSTANEAEVESLARSLEPEAMGSFQEAMMLQSRTTYYFDVLEQLVGRLPDEYIESTVLAYLKPYLDVATQRAPFESAHSVVLAIYSQDRAVAHRLVPFYTHLLLRSFPDLMTATQLRLGFTTMMRCISASDDALAWWCILQLVDATASIPISPSPLSPAPTKNAPGRPMKPLSALTDLDGKQQEAVQQAASAEDYDPNKDQPTRLDAAGGPTPLETQALELRRGHLLLALIDQITVINLVLLRSLLDRIWEFILEEGQEEREERKRRGKDALLKVLFATLGDGLDMTKREEGIRWWLARRWQQAHL